MLIVFQKSVIMANIEKFRRKNMFSKLKNIFIGRPLKSSDEGDEGNLLTKLQALAMLSSDALSSIAYGPEQVVLVLVSVSAGAIWWSLPCLLYTSPSPRDISGSRMPSSA